jgi:hypothetical protein
MTKKYINMLKRQGYLMLTTLLPEGKQQNKLHHTIRNSEIWDKQIHQNSLGADWVGS